MTSPSTRSARAIFPHVIIPSWLALGATFKMLESDARLLPKSVLQTLGHLGLTEGNMLSYSLAGMVGVEFLLAGLMFARSKFARPAAAAILGLFCLILGVELAGGADSCGCLGAWSPHPAVMLGIDGGLLAGLLLTWRRAGRTHNEACAWRMGAAAAVVTAGVVVIQTARTEATPQTTPETRVTAGTEGNFDNNETTDLVPTPVQEPRPPANWYCTDFDAYVGQHWQDLALFRWCSIPPDESTTHIVFYSRNCDHCEEMFHFDLVGRDDLTSGILAVEIPDADAEIAADGSLVRNGSEWPLPETACTYARLPNGTNWIITAPLVVGLVNGTITCISEGDHTPCMDLE